MHDVHNVLIFPTSVWIEMTFIRNTEVYVCRVRNVLMKLYCIPAKLYCKNYLYDKVSLYSHLRMRWNSSVASNRYPGMVLGNVLTVTLKPEFKRPFPGIRILNDWVPPQTLKSVTIKRTDTDGLTFFLPPGQVLDVLHVVEAVACTRLRHVWRCR